MAERTNTFGQTTDELKNTQSRYFDTYGVYEMLGFFFLNEGIFERFSKIVWAAKETIDIEQKNVRENFV